MARIESDPNYTSPTFSRSTAATDPFKKEDVQLVAAALSTHDHSTGKGVAIGAGSIPNGTITGAMIADGTIATADLADGSVTSQKIADGTIQSTDIAAASITNAKLGPDVARDNLLTNGGFEIWQRGTSGFSTTGTYTADRWQMNTGAGSTANVAQTPSTIGSQGRSAQVVYTHGGGGGFFTLEQKHENYVQLRGKTVTFSMRVKSTVNGSVALTCSDGVAAPSSAYNSGTGEQVLSVTSTINASASQLNTYVIINVASCTVELNDAMLVVSPVAVDYVPLHPADDLARCLRYYENMVDFLGTPPIGGGMAVSATGTQHWIYYKVPKAVNPTVTVSSPSAFATQYANGVAAIFSALAQSTGNKLSSALAGTVPATMVAGNHACLFGYTGSPQISAEANP